MITTLKFGLRRDPANSQAIGYLATQQNAAYNVAVDVLNREPHLPKRSGKKTPDAMNKRITAWRKANRKKASAPYHTHQQGSEAAWEANQLLQHRRAERLERIEKAIAEDEEPKHRDTRPHRRTLAHRSRKHRRLSLTITDRRIFEVSEDGQTLTSQQCGFTLHLRAHQTLKWLDIRSIRLEPVKRYGPRTPIQRRHYCLHVQVAVPEPMPLEKLDIQELEDILGTDRGTKNHVAVSSGHRAHHRGGTQRRNSKRKHQQHIAGKPRNSKRRRHAVAKDRERARRYTQRRDQDMRRQIRDILLEAKPKLVAVESLHPISMMSRYCSRTEQELQSQTKAQRKSRPGRHRPHWQTPHRGSRQTRPTHRLRPAARHVPDLPALRRPAPEPPREPSGVPVPELWPLRPRRLDCRRYHPQPGLRPALRMAVRLHRRQQPSRSLPYQPKLGLELSVFKPEGTVTSSHQNRVRGPRPDHRTQAAGPDAKSVTKS